MCHKLDMRFFQELAAMDPDEVCRNAICEFDPERRAYKIEAWGQDCEVFPDRGEIRPATPPLPPVGVEFGLAILFYLMRAGDLPVAGEWISEKDLPGGVTFFRGPHAVPARLIAERFTEDIDGFRAACEELGGAPVDLADAAYSFRFLPRVPVAVLFWRADEEFDAEARLLFDRTISEHLPIDVIFGLSEEVCFRLARARDAASSWY